MKIFYVHHAARVKNNPPTQDDGIMPIGKKDAKLVAKMFSIISQSNNIVAIYSAPYFRYKETARLINKYIKVPIIFDERLNEFASIRHVLKYGLDPNTAEEWTACQNRIISCVKDIVDKYNENDTVICVTSSVNLTAFVSMAYKIKPSENLPFPFLPSCSPICFDINKSNFEEIGFKDK